MTNCTLSSFVRILACCVLIVFCLGFCLTIQVGAAGPVVVQGAPAGPKIWLQDSQPLSVTHVGPAAASMGSARPLSMVSADFDEDGIQDLLVGYSTPAGGVVVWHRGNLDAFAPQSDESFQAIGRGEFPSPFLPEARTFVVPVNPDFIAAGNFTGLGHQDLAVAAHGGNALYIFAGDGKGNFTGPQTINLPGGVTALASGSFGGMRPALIVGTSNGRQSFLEVYGPGPQGLAAPAAIPLSAPASNLLFADFGDPGMDVAFLSGGNIQILRWPTGQLITVTLPVSVQAFALGSFIHDRSYGPQIALLAPDGSVAIAVRNEFDPRLYAIEEVKAIRQAKINHQPAPAFVPAPSFPANGWRIVEAFPAVSTVAPGRAPVFFRTRVSTNGADDIMWLSAGSGQMVLISHPDAQPGAATFPPGQVSVKPYSGTPIVASAMRLNVDGRLGVLALHQGEIAPSLSEPIPDPNFFVNTDKDPAPTSPIANACNNTSFADVSSSCSLREAILKANGDTIMLQAGHTYSLTIGKVANDFSGNFGALYVNNTATIVGGNQNTTIIQWGTPGSGTVDMVMAVNEDISPITNATASISNLTIQNGVNHGIHSNDGDGGCMEFDTGTNGTATLTLTNVTLQNCSTLQGGGGGLVIFNFVKPTGGGGATISNSIIQGNSVVDVGAAGNGGGIAIAQDGHMTMTNSQVKNNSAVQNCTPTCGLGDGGGIVAFAPQSVSAATAETFIHSSTISGNQSAGFGGGINSGTDLSIDQGTVISGNTAGSDGSNATAHANQEGGGLYSNPAATCPLLSTCTTTLSKVTITGNKATGNGGGISHGNASAGTTGSLTMSFSRFAANATSGGSGSNLNNNHATATVTNNWWGTNAVASTINTISGTTTFDPFIVLTHTASPAKIRINQSTTLTANMSLDDKGSGGALSGNLDQIVGLPITFDGATLGASIPQAQPEALGNPVPTATATFNASTTSGLATVNATLEKSVTGLENYAVAVNTNLIASAVEIGTTATITTVGANGFSAGDFVTISGVTTGTTCAGYNGSFFQVTAVSLPTQFSYTAPSGLTTCSGGTASTGIIILEPPSITKTFSPKTIQTTAGAGTTVSTITFTLQNQNVVPIDASFADTLPTVGGPHPASLLVAASPTVVNNCGGTVTATAGAGSISFSNTALAAGTCTIQVNVSSSVDAVFSNSVTIDSTDAGNGNTSSDTLNVINPPHIVKNFGATTIPLNGTTSLTITVDNGNNQNQTLSGITFTDTLPNAAPGTLVVANPNNLTNNCTGTATAAAGSGSASLGASSLAPGASCTVSLNVQGTVAGAANNSVNASDATAGTGNTATALLTVIAPPTISKSFSPKSIPLNSNSTLSFTLTNPNTASALSGVAFTDTLPAGLKLASTTVTGSCGSGTITATINNPPGTPSTVSLSGGTLTASPAAGSSCTFSVGVTGISAGAQVNTTGTVSSTEGGTGGTASDTLIVVAPPTISKSFSPKSVPLNSNSTLSFTVSNPNTASALSGVAFTDTLPGGLKLASATVIGSCGSGTITATINNPPGTPSTVALSGGTLTASPDPASSCTFSVSVTGISAGAQVNTTGNVSSTEGGTGGTASDTLTVVAPPTISKSFSPKSIPLNGASTLSFTVTNPNTTSALSGVAFTDALPAGLKLASTIVTGSCGSGTITATINNPPGAPSTVTLSGGTLTASPDPASSCTFSVSVTGISAAAQVNTTGNVSSTEGGTGGTASDTLTVIAPPTFTKAFGHATVPLNQSDTLSFTITNPNTASALSGIAFTDTLPGGLKLASTTVTGSCGSGTITATINNPPGTPSTVSLSGGTLTASPAAGSSCTFSVGITGISPGVQSNTTSTITSTEGGTGAAASNTITVVGPPTTTKVFNPTQISVGATSTMTITITNPSATAGLTGVGFTDTFPANLVVANPNGLSNSCNGAVVATAGSGAVSLTGGTIAANSSCSVAVNVTSSVSGTYVNSTGPVSSTEGGAGTAASATLTVASPPTMTKSFGASTIPLNGTTSLTFTVTNPNSGLALTQVGFTDTLPVAPGTLVVATPNGLANNTCNVTPTAVAGSGTISLTGATLSSNSSCTFTVNVQGTVAGAAVNSVTPTSFEGGTGVPATASITVVGPPTLQKSFGAASIALNVATTTLSFQVANPNSGTTLTGIGFADNLPAGLQLASTTVTGTCGGGTITPVVGPPSSVTLTGASLAGGASCSFSLNVMGTAAGSQTNTTGAVSSVEGGTGGTASASIAVVAPPSIAKAFNPNGIPLNGVSTLTFTITNPAANTVAEAGVAFTDSLPAGLVVATPNGAIGNCNGGTFTATSGSGTIMLAGGSVPINSNCSLSVNITASQGGVLTNTTGSVSSTNGGTGNTASDTLTVASPPTIAKSFSAVAVGQNSTVAVSFTVSNPNTSVTLTGISFTDNLPAGLVVASPNQASSTCGGTVTAVPGSSTITFTGGSLAPPGPPPLRARGAAKILSNVASGTCVVNVNLLVTGTGTISNVTNAISANESGPGVGSNTATLEVVLAPTVNKVFGATQIPLNGTTSLTFNIADPNGFTALVGIALNDALPAGLVVANPNGLTGSCVASSVIAANPGGGAIDLSSLNLPASGSCSFSVNVTGTSGGAKNNVTGNISATFDDGFGTFRVINGGSAAATLAVVAPPAIAKAFVPPAIAPGGVTSLTFTITNPAVNSVALTGVAFTDTLPANVLVATPNGLAGNCNGGAVTATAGSGSINLTGGSIPAGGSCVISVNVTSSVIGSSTNTTGAVSSTNGGTGNTASAALTVANANLAITKSHQGTFTRGQNGAQYTLHVSNAAGAGPTTGTVTVVDTLPVISNPHNLVPVSLAGTGWSCNLGTLTCTRSDALAPGASYPDITFTVNIPIDITNHFTNTATVSGGGDPNSHTGADPVNVGPPLTITPVNPAASTPDGAPATYSFIVDATAASSPLGAITFGCGGLPIGAQCSFNPPSENQPFDTISLQVATTPPPTHAFVTPFGFGDRPGVYAMLLPMLGLAAIVVLPGRRGSKRKKAWLRLTFALGGMAFLLALAGCGGRPTHNTFTPLGTYTITVSASAGATNASTTITLTVQ